MKIVHASGDARSVGQQTGEELREEIRAHLQLFPSSEPRDSFQRRLSGFLAALDTHLPAVLEEMEGTAEGANLPVEEILRLNLPGYGGDLVVSQGCTNVAFADGPEGPIWGNNNDGGPPGQRRPACCRVVRRKGAVPQVSFTFCGMVATLDAVNAEGVAVGHSSVGSVFQQSDDHVPIRLWGYEALMHAHSAVDFLRTMTSVPTRGKGYTMVCADARGTVCSIEAPCPLMQVRWPPGGQGYVTCVNHYQLPALANADRRTEDGKRNSQARQRVLDELLAGEREFGLNTMKRLLRHHGDPSLCRHGGADRSYTEYAMVGLLRSRRVLYLDGNPCESEYAEVAL